MKLGEKSDVCRVRRVQLIAATMHADATISGGRNKWRNGAGMARHLVSGWQVLVPA